jgi:hypothetical protein
MIDAQDLHQLASLLAAASIMDFFCSWVSAASSASFAGAPGTKCQ